MTFILDLPLRAADSTDARASACQKATSALELAFPFSKYIPESRLAA